MSTNYFMSDWPRLRQYSLPGLFAPNPILELDTKYDQETTSAAIFGHANTI